MARIIQSALKAVAALLLTGCSSQLASRAQHSDGLLDFVVGDSSKAITIAPGDSDRITATRLRACGGRFYVSGVVRRAPLREPPRGSHIDVLVLDAKRRVLASVPVDYSPRRFSPARRGQSGQSRFTARLEKLPPRDATIELVFHDAPHRLAAVAEAPGNASKTSRN